MSQYANEPGNPVYTPSPERKEVWEETGTIQVIFDGENYTECQYFSTDADGENDYRVGVPVAITSAYPMAHVLECAVYGLKDKFPTLEVKNVGIYSLIEKAKV